MLIPLILTGQLSSNCANHTTQEYTQYYTINHRHRKIEPDLAAAAAERRLCNISDASLKPGKDKVLLLWSPIIPLSDQMWVEFDIQLPIPKHALNDKLTLLHDQNDTISEEIKFNPCIALNELKDCRVSSNRSENFCTLSLYDASRNIKLLRKEAINLYDLLAAVISCQ